MSSSLVAFTIREGEVHTFAPSPPTEPPKVPSKTCLPTVLTFSHISMIFSVSIDGVIIVRSKSSAPKETHHTKNGKTNRDSSHIFSMFFALLYDFIIEIIFD